jgi:hypothetical protein
MSQVIKISKKSSSSNKPSGKAPTSLPTKSTVPSKQDDLELTLDDPDDNELELDEPETVPPAKKSSNKAKESSSKPSNSQSKETKPNNKPKADEDDHYSNVFALYNKLDKEAQLFPLKRKDKERLSLNLASLDPERRKIVCLIILEHYFTNTPITIRKTGAELANWIPYQGKQKATHLLWDMNLLPPRLLNILERFIMNESDNDAESKPVSFLSKDNGKVIIRDDSEEDSEQSEESSDEREIEL